MFHGIKNIRKIIMKRAIKGFLEKGSWNIVLFGIFSENKVVIYK